MYSGTPIQLTKPWKMFAVDGGIQIQTNDDQGYRDYDPAIQHAREAGYNVDDAGWLLDHNNQRLCVHIPGTKPQVPWDV